MAKGRGRLNKKLTEVVWFLVKFNLLAIPLYLIMYMNLNIPAAQSFVANIINSMLNVFGYESVVEGYFLRFSVGMSIVSIEINFDCIGWKSVYALFALVAATPRIVWERKLKFLIIGLPAIFVINIIRIFVTIIVIMNFGISYLEIVHNLLWQEGLILAVVGLWYLWLKKAMKGIKT